MRLQYHPSIVLWSTNNENEVSFFFLFHSLFPFLLFSFFLTPLNHNNTNNNNKKVMLADNWYGIPQEIWPYYVKQYSQLYFDTVISTIELYDKVIIYFPFLFYFYSYFFCCKQSRSIIASSPSNGNEVWKRKKERTGKRKERRKRRKKGKEGDLIDSPSDRC